MNQFGLSVYGVGNAEISVVRNPNLPLTFVADQLLQRCNVSGQPLKSIKDIYYRYELSSNGFGYFYFENRAKKQIYLISIQLSAPLLNCNFSSIY